MTTDVTPVKASHQGVAPTRIISLGGGKGGVGKSIVACNLAIAIAQTGKRVVLADLDLGAANQHLLLGVDRPRPGIDTLLARDTSDPRAGLSPTKVPGLALLAGSGARLGAANITHAEKRRILKKLRGLDADVVMIDVGAGVGYNALDFFELGTQRLVVTTPQVTAIHDAYSFLKSAVLRTLQHASTRGTETSLLDTATSSGEADKVVDLLARLRVSHPAFAARIFDVLGRFGAQLIGNQVVDPAQVGIFTAVSKMMSDYLGITVPILGWLRNSPRVAESVNLRAPLLLGQGSAEHARVFRVMAETLLVEDIAADDDLLLEDEGDAANSPLELAPGALPLEAMPHGSEPPPMPTFASADARSATPDPPRGSIPHVHVYQAPPRKKRVEPEPRRSAESRRRRPSLPGLTPAARRP